MELYKQPSQYKKHFYIVKCWHPAYRTLQPDYPKHYLKSLASNSKTGHPEWSHMWQDAYKFKNKVEALNAAYYARAEEPEVEKIQVVTTKI